MYAYLTLLFKICLFQHGPQAIPRSNVLLRLSIIIYSLSSYLLLQLSVNNLEALLQISVEIGITLCFIGLLLYPSQKLPRFTQTACAFFGTDVITSLFAMPVFATLSLNSSNLLALLAMLALMIWHWLINAHIIRHAIDESLPFSLGLSFLYIFSNYQMMSVLFPVMSSPS